MSDIERKLGQPSNTKRNADLEKNKGVSSHKTREEGSNRGRRLVTRGGEQVG